MKTIQIPSESEYVLTAMYKEFLDRYTKGIPRNKAKIFGHQSNIANLVPEIWEEDLKGLLDELKEFGLISATGGSNIYQYVSLTTNGISYMEYRAGNKIEDAIKSLVSLKSLLPSKN